MAKSYYDTLGVKPDATNDEIKRAYRRKAAHHHPDRGGDPNTMSEINRAYSTLKDPVSRLTYDQTGEEPKDRDALARDIVMNMFMDILKTNPKGNYVGIAYGNIVQRIQKEQNELSRVQQVSASLRARRNRIKKKKRGGINLWHALVDKELEAGKVIKAQIERNIQGCKDALDLLDNYEGKEEELAQYMIETISTTGSTATKVIREFKINL